MIKIISKKSFMEAEDKLCKATTQLKHLTEEIELKDKEIAIQKKDIDYYKEELEKQASVLSVRLKEYSDLNDKHAELKKSFNNLNLKNSERIVRLADMQNEINSLRAKVTELVEENTKLKTGEKAKPVTTKDFDIVVKGIDDGKAKKIAKNLSGIADCYIRKDIFKEKSNIVIEDTGKGISKSDLEEVTKPKNDVEAFVEDLENFSKYPKKKKKASKKNK